MKPLFIVLLALTISLITSCDQFEEKCHTCSLEIRKSYCPEELICDAPSIYANSLWEEWETDIWYFGKSGSSKKDLEEKCYTEMDTLKAHRSSYGGVWYTQVRYFSFNGKTVSCGF